MWNYDELFAEGNIVGVKNLKLNKITVESIDSNLDKQFYIEDFGSETLDYFFSNEIIQYIIRLDEKGNVIEHLFDREIDMPILFLSKKNKCPLLKSGMYIRICNGGMNNSYIGMLSKDKKEIYFSNHYYLKINDLIKTNEKIVEIYPSTTNSYNFSACTYDKAIWRDKEYEEYLNGKR